MSENIIPQETKKYMMEIYDEADQKKVYKEAYLLPCEGIELLFRNLVTDNEVVEFSGLMKSNPEKLYDEFENAYEDFNVIEITNIKKVKKYD